MKGICSIGTIKGRGGRRVALQHTGSSFRFIFILRRNACNDAIDLPCDAGNLPLTLSNKNEGLGKTKKKHKNTKIS